MILFDDGKYKIELSEDKDNYYRVTLSKDDSVIVREIISYDDALEIIKTLEEENNKDTAVFRCKYDVVNNERTVLGQQERDIQAKSKQEAKNKLRNEIYKRFPSSQYNIVNLRIEKI